MKWRPKAAKERAAGTRAPRIVHSAKRHPSRLTRANHSGVKKTPSTLKKTDSERTIPVPRLRRTVIAAGDTNKAAANRESAQRVGKAIAQKLLEKKVENVVFDRGGYIFHGKVKALADAAREGGLKF